MISSPTRHPRSKHTTNNAEQPGGYARVLGRGFQVLIHQLIEFDMIYGTATTRRLFAALNKVDQAVPDCASRMKPAILLCSSPIMASIRLHPAPTTPASIRRCWYLVSRAAGHRPGNAQHLQRRRCYHR